MSEYQSIKAPQVDVEAAAEETNQQNQTRRYLKLAVAGNVILLLVLAASMISGGTNHSLVPAGVPVEGYPVPQISDYQNCVAYDDKGAELGYATEDGHVYKLSGFAKDMAAGRQPDFFNMDRSEVDEYYYDVAVGEYIDIGGGNAIFHPVTTSDGRYPPYFGDLHDQTLNDYLIDGQIEMRGYVFLYGPYGDVLDLEYNNVGTVEHNGDFLNPHAEAQCGAAAYFLNEALPRHVDYEW